MIFFFIFEGNAIVGAQNNTPSTSEVNSTLPTSSVEMRETDLDLPVIKTDQDTTPQLETSSSTTRKSSSGRKPNKKS